MSWTKCIESAEYLPIYTSIKRMTKSDETLLERQITTQAYGNCKVAN